MKVMHLGQAIGGLGVYIRNVCLYSSDEISFFIVRGKKDKSAQFFNSKGARIREFEINLYRSINFFYDFLAFFQTLRIVLKEKPNLIHAHSAKGGILGRSVGFFTRTPVLYTPHAFSFMSFQRPRQKKAFLLIERFTKFDAYLLACSNSELQIGKNVVNYNIARALLWSNSIPRSSQFSHDSNAENRIEKYVCTVGRPSYQKNTLFLIEVVADIVKRIPDFKLKIIGVGYYSPYNTAVKNCIAKLELGRNVELIEWLPHEVVQNYLRNTLFYITVSLYEGLPLSVLECMAEKKAILASKVPGNIDCVEDSQNGFLINLEDKAMFVQKTCLLWESPDLRLRLGKASQEMFIKKFELRNTMGDLEQIYKTFAKS